MILPKFRPTLSALNLALKYSNLFRDDYNLLDNVKFYNLNF